MLNYGVIVDNQKLKDFCNEIMQEKFVGVDTEFMRDKTYYPKLCLIQIASIRVCAIIDPVVKNIDILILRDIILNPKIVKIFHSAKQDIEVLCKVFGACPVSIFDTQIASMFCGLGIYISYRDLVHKIFNMSINKSNQTTNWSTRPLRRDQIDYALIDVKYLSEAYQDLQRQLKKCDRVLWMEEEMIRLANIDNYHNRPKDAWRKTKIGTGYHIYIHLIKALMKWREQKAQERDRPRNRIIDDDAITRVVECYKNHEEIKLRNLSLQKEILDVLKQNDIVSEKSSDNVAAQQQYSDNKQVLSMLKIVLNLRCQEAGIAPSLVSTNLELAEFVKKQSNDNKILQGWRYEVFGKYAIDLIEGRIGIHINDNQLKLK